MKTGRFWAWAVFGLGAAYFFIPLLATVEFSMRMRRGVHSFDAYEVVLSKDRDIELGHHSVVVTHDPRIQLLAGL